MAAEQIEPFQAVPEIDEVQTRQVAAENRHFHTPAKLRIQRIPFLHTTERWLFSHHKLAIMRGEAGVLPGPGFQEQRAEVSNTYSDVSFLSHLLAPHFSPFILPLFRHYTPHFPWVAGSTD